ncbi:MAG: CoA-binding protein [Bacteroidales bacterium]
MATLRQIEDFIAAQPIALAGVSRNPKKFGYVAFKELKEKGLDIIPVNPSADEILGTRVYPDINSLPGNTKGIIVMTRKDQTGEVVKTALARGIKNIWIQQMSETKEAIADAKDNGANLISGQCILMYYKPNGFHKFHGAIKKFFGGYPK